MPNGELYIPGGQVIIESVGRGDGGEYQCVENTTDGTTISAKMVYVQCKYRVIIVASSYTPPCSRPSHCLSAQDLPLQS